MKAISCAKTTTEW